MVGHQYELGAFRREPAKRESHSFRRWNCQTAFCRDVKDTLQEV